MIERLRRRSHVPHGIQSRWPRILRRMASTVIAGLPLLILSAYAYADALSKDVTLSIGGIAQIGGALLVVIMLYRTRKAFGQPSWLRSVAAVLTGQQGIPRLGPQPMNRGDRLSPEHRRRPRKPLQSTNPRPTEAHLQSLDNSIQNLWGSIEYEAAKRTEQINALREHMNNTAERQVRTEQQLYDKLQEAALSDEGLNLVGVALFLQGIACATWPKAIAEAISGVL